MIVVDTSAMIEVLINSPAGRRIARRIADPDLSLHAPHLLDIEVTQVLRSYVLKRLMAEDRARQILEDFSQLDIHRYEHHQLLLQVWRFRHRVTAYDASYVALAVVLDAPVLTMDRRLAKTPGLPVAFEVF